MPRVRRAAEFEDLAAKAVAASLLQIVVEHDFDVDETVELLATAILLASDGIDAEEAQRRTEVVMLNRAVRRHPAGGSS